MNNEDHDWLSELADKVAADIAEGKQEYTEYALETTNQIMQRFPGKGSEQLRDQIYSHILEYILELEAKAVCARLH